MKQKRQFAILLMLLVFLGLLLQYELAWLNDMAEDQKEQRTSQETARNYYELYENIWEDLRCFPVPSSSLEPKRNVSFENSWMFERSYGGSYGHEGTDLMPDTNKNGCYPVLSITDGIVEKIGWLEKGGYRIGIRSPGDVYFYYAHLDSYAKEFQPGDVIEAGELLGFMGDTGYGPEGTRGKFKVHLHIGIYVRPEEVSEVAVNPYWFLKYLENRKLSYAYE